jgi:hypothetical protein
MDVLPFRQIHLDFHTSEAIGNIGARFSREQFQGALKLGHVNSITVFSKCHHGWAYHPSTANEMHPGLSFDLLGEQIAAAHEIGVKTPVYISAGLDEKMTRRHPEWLFRNRDESTSWAKNFLVPGYHEFCFNTPYLDYLLAQVKEVTERYDADGLFLDIVGVRSCYCQHCISAVRKMGKSPDDRAAMMEIWENTYANYTRRVEEIVHGIKPGLRIFHNGGHIRRGRRDLAAMDTHLELESLPTGGWGYDHFPLSARYVQQLGMEILGMTGKFHTTWGEFGGFKHPNALRYEAALSMANGAKCSIGDQLHPEGEMDMATYRLVGTAYAESETKEAWCGNVENVADVGLLSVEACGLSDADTGGHGHSGRIESGAVRMLLEGKILFDVLDLDSDFTPYKVIVLPDRIRLDGALKSKLDAFLKTGGKVLATGESGLTAAGTDVKTEFALDFGVKWLEANPFNPDYFIPSFPMKNLFAAAYIFYGQGQRVELTGGLMLGERQDPYFNRETFTFCSHQHTPGSGKSGGPGMVEGPDGIYFAWNVFEDYATKGSLILRETVLYALNRLLPVKTLETNLPAQGIVTLMHQKADNRYVNHMLYVSPVKRGEGIEVIEDILPVRGVDIGLRLPHGESVKSVRLVPQGESIAFDQRNGKIFYTVPELLCHQMVEIAY